MQATDSETPDRQSHPDRVRAVGRFAPSPSGPLHAGSVATAIGSYLSARSQGGSWLLRIEDVDGARVRPGAATAIQQQLESLGLEWDGPVLWQSGRRDAYDAALQQLVRQAAVYPCACTRRDLAAGRGICPCAGRNVRRPRSWRLRFGDMDPGPWEDRCLGICAAALPETPPVVLRADGYHAYLLASVVDDAAQGVTEVFRGEDLLSMTPQQRHLQSLLGFPHPVWGHLPLVRDGQGRKLSKSAGAAGWTAADPGGAWESSLRHLGWAVPGTLRGAPAQHWKEWALERFPSAGCVPRLPEPAVRDRPHRGEP